MTSIPNEERYLLKLLIARSMARDVQDVALPTLAETDGGKGMINGAASTGTGTVLSHRWECTSKAPAGSASALLANAFLSIPTVASRMDSPEVEQAAQLLLKENLSQMVWKPSGGGTASGVKASLAEVLTNVMYGTAVRNLELAGSTDVAASSPAMTAEAAPRSVRRTIETIAAAHSTSELSAEAHAAIGYFQRKAVDRILEVANNPGQLTGLRLFLSLVPQRLCESVLAYSTSTRATEWILDLVLKRRALFGGHSILYHIARQFRGAQAAKAHIANQTVRLTAAERQRLDALLEGASPHMARGGDPKAALAHVIGAHEAEQASAAPSAALLTLLGTHIERLQTKALHRLVDDDVLANGIRQIAPALHGPLFETLRQCKALKPMIRAAYDLLRVVAFGDLSGAAPEATPAEASQMEAAAAEAAAEDFFDAIEAAAESAPIEPAAGASRSGVAGMPAPLARPMRGMADALFMAAHEAAQFRPEGCVPFVHWLLHESFVNLATPRELERRIGLRALFAELEAKHGEGAEAAAVSAASAGLQRTLATLGGAHFGGGPDALTPFDLFSGVGVRSTSDALPEALARLEPLFDTRLYGLLADMKRRQQVAREGMADGVTPMTNVDASEAGPIVALEVLHGAEDEEAMRSRGYLPVRSEAEAIMAVQGGATLWVKHVPAGAAEDAVPLAPIAEIRLTTRSSQVDALFEEGASWVCVPRPLGTGKMASACVWYRRCGCVAMAIGGSAVVALTEAPITTIAYVSPRAHGGNLAAAVQAARLPAATSTVLEHVELGGDVGLRGATKKVLSGMWIANKFSSVGGELLLGFGCDGQVV